MLLGQELIALCVQLCSDLVISAIKHNCAQDMHNSKEQLRPHHSRPWADAHINDHAVDICDSSRS